MQMGSVMAGCGSFVQKLAKGELSKKQALVLAALAAITSVGTVYCSSLAITFKATLLATVSVLALGCLVWAIFARCCLSPDTRTSFQKAYDIAKRLGGGSELSLSIHANAQQIEAMIGEKHTVACGKGLSEQVSDEARSYKYIALKLKNSDAAFVYLFFSSSDEGKTFQFRVALGKPEVFKISTDEDIEAMFETVSQKGSIQGQDGHTYYLSNLLN